MNTNTNTTTENKKVFYKKKEIIDKKITDLVDQIDTNIEKHPIVFEEVSADIDRAISTANYKFEHSDRFLNHYNLLKSRLEPLKKLLKRLEMDELSDKPRP